MNTNAIRNLLIYKDYLVEYTSKMFFNLAQEKSSAYFEFLNNQVTALFNKMDNLHIEADLRNDIFNLKEELKQSFIIEVSNILDECDIQTHHLFFDFVSSEDTNKREFRENLQGEYKTVFQNNIERRRWVDRHTFADEVESDIIKIAGVNKQSILFGHFIKFHRDLTIYTEIADKLLKDKRTENNNQIEQKTSQPNEQGGVQNLNSASENNFKESTIEDSLLVFKENKSMNETDYKILLTLLLTYFEKNEITTLSKPLFVKNGNKKHLGFALGEIFKNLKNEALSFEYLELGKNNISIFKNENIEKTRYNKSNLYKYYTTKP